MRAQSALHALIGLLACVAVAAAPAPGVAQGGGGEGSDSADETPARTPPQTRAGGIFGARPPQMTTSGDDLTSGQVQRDDEGVNDDRTDLLVFDLEYHHGVEFRDSYRERFETAFWEAVDESPVYRALPEAERQRRMARAAQLVTGGLREEDAERMAEAIGVTHYLIARIEAADARHYRVRLTLGEVGAGALGVRELSRETNRTIDNVEDAVEDLAAQAVGE